jgi:hypothetical protein
MLGLLIASFLCYFVGFIGPFAFVGKLIIYHKPYILGVICLLLTATLNYLVDFLPSGEQPLNKLTNT